MTLNAFLGQNPQVVYDVKKDFYVSAHDLEDIDKFIKQSPFLQSRRSFKWLTQNVDNMRKGLYQPYERYNKPKSPHDTSWMSHHFKDERTYTKEELDALIVRMEDIDF